MAANMFNDPPAPGKQFFMFNLSLTYNGNGSGNLFAITPFLYAVGAANVAYSPGLSDYCGVVPDDLPTTTVFAGGTVTGNECFSVLATDASSLVLYFDGSAQTFFSLR
jgi:hypothetical protein